MTYKILCVDDEPLVLRAVVRMLADEYHVDTASSGDEALEAMRDCGPYATVLSDMHMPGMDTPTFLRQAYELAPATPRVLLTGYQDPALARRSVGEGRAFRFLSKPCSGSVMRSTLKEAIKEYEAALLGRHTQPAVRVEASEIASPAALAVAATVESLFRSVFPELST